MRRRTFCKSTLAAAAAATFPACGTRVADAIPAVSLAGDELMRGWMPPTLRGAGQDTLGTDSESAPQDTHH